MGYGLWVIEPFLKESHFWESIGDNKCFPKGSTYEISEGISIITLLEIDVF